MLGVNVGNKTKMLEETKMLGGNVGKRQKCWW